MRQSGCTTISVTNVAVNSHGKFFTPPAMPI